jgi:hypothetical protein
MKGRHGRSKKFRGNGARATIFLSIVFAKEQLAKGRRGTPEEMEVKGRMRWRYL